MITPDPAPTALTPAAPAIPAAPATGPVPAAGPDSAAGPVSAAGPGPAGGQEPPGGTVPLRQAEFVVVDVETTGWQPEVARITEIAAVRVRGGEVRETFSALVNPGCPIPAPVAELTGITDTLIAGAPPVADVLPRFLDFARGGVLIAHNAPFDVGFLAAACRASGLAWPSFPVLDTVALARVMLSPGQVADCKLATLAGYFGAAVTPRHRALADAMATADVLAGLLALLEAAGVTSLAEAGRLVSERAAAAAGGWAGGTGGDAPARWWLRWRRRHPRRGRWRRRRDMGPLPR
jgi:DNA polymerase-3 subunit epsilon